MKQLLITLSFLVAFSGCKSDTKKTNTDGTTQETTEEVEKESTSSFEVYPISHATMVIEWDGTVIYIDPVGGGDNFSKYQEPDLILVTDIHGDHLNAETIQAVGVSKTKIMVPKAVADKLPASLEAQIDILNNGDIKERFGFSVEAIPMYNLRTEALDFHKKGRGNGYVIEKAGKRVYISGDTEDIPEMRALKGIDIAFVCMNLPYTMTVQSAADAVLEFKPKTVYPYHYRGTEGLSDVSEFKSILYGGNPDLGVVQLDWYPNKK